MQSHKEVDNEHNPVEAETGKCNIQMTYIKIFDNQKYKALIFTQLGGHTIFECFYCETHLSNVMQLQ